MNINMMLKYYKFGFGRATDTCCEFIRQGKLKRSQAIPIIEKYDGNCSDEIIQRYCEYTSIMQHFWDVNNNCINEKLFCKINQRPIPKFKVGLGL